MQNLKTILNLFQNLDESVQVITVQVFLEIAQHEELSSTQPLCVSDLMDRLHMSLAAASRHSRKLSAVRRQGDAGLGLIDMVQDPITRNRKNLHLTTKGKRLYGDIERLLD